MGIRGAIEDIQPFAELAQNATTLVYKAYQRSLERFVLLKRLRPEFTTDEDLSERFQEEARLIARLPHPNIVTVYSYGSDADGAYIVAEYVEGVDLQALIERRRIPPSIALFILLEAARGLKAAHDKDILHRDLKPSNILISNEGEVKLSDFGFASISDESSPEPGEIRGTLPYLAPEQVLGERVDRRSDLFSLGAVFYEMLTRRRAFAGSTSSEIFESLLHHDPAPFLSATPGVTPGVEDICLRLMAKSPSQRYGSADDVIADVEAARAGSVGHAGPDQLKTFLEDPDAFAVAAAPRVGAEAPEVSIVPDGPQADRAPGERAQRGAPLRRRLTLAGVFLLAAAGIIYAGTAMLSDTSSVDDAEQASLEETMITDPLTLPADEGEAADLDSLLQEDLEIASDVAPGDREDEPLHDRTPPPVLSERPEREVQDAEPENEPARSGRLVIRVDPAAEVFVDGASVGAASGAEAVSLDLEEGTHSVTLRNRYFPTYRERVTVTPDAPQVLNVSLFDLVGRLDLHVLPYAYVYVDGDSLGVTPFNPPLILTPGVHQLRLVHEGLNVDHLDEVTIEKGRTLRKEYDLTRLSKR